MHASVLVAVAVVALLAAACRRCCRRTSRSCSRCRTRRCRRWPSSHCSPASVLTLQSPHVAVVQLTSQRRATGRAVVAILRRAGRIVLDAVAALLVRLAVRAAAVAALVVRRRRRSRPSPTSITPLPQVSSDLQSALQPSPPSVLPSSQASPIAVSTTPLPHVSSLSSRRCSRRRRRCCRRRRPRPLRR